MRRMLLCLLTVLCVLFSGNPSIAFTGMTGAVPEIVLDEAILDDSVLTNDNADLEPNPLSLTALDSDIDKIEKDDVNIVETKMVDYLEPISIQMNRNALSFYKNELAKKCNSDYGYQDIINNIKSDAKKNLYENIDVVEQAFFNSGTNLTPENNYLTVSYDDSLSFEDIEQVYTLYRNDHPLYYWMTGSLSVSDESVGMVCDNDFLNSAAREVEYQKILDALDTYADYCAGSTSNFTYATAMVYLMAQQIDYAYNESVEPETENWAHSIVGVFDDNYHEAVCEGYAKAYQLLLNYFDVPNIYIVGSASGNTGDGSELVLHAWNLVQMDDGAYYWADPTWSDVDLRRNLFGELITEKLHILNNNYMEDYPERVRYSYHLKGNSFIETHNPLSSSNVGSLYLYDFPKPAESDFEPEIEGEKAIESLYQFRTIIGEYLVGNENMSLAVVQNDGIHRAVEVHWFGRGIKDQFIPAEVTYNGVEYHVAGVDLGTVDFETETVTLDEGIHYMLGTLNYDIQQTKDIYLPSTLEYIECSEISHVSIENIYVNDNNSYISDAEGVLFDKDKTTLIRYPMDKSSVSFEIPSTVNRINSWAFWNCKILENLTIPSSVTKIGDYAFRGMEKLNELYIPESVKELPDYVAMESYIHSIHISTSTLFTDVSFESVYGLENIEVDEGNPCGYTFDGGLYMYLDALHELELWDYSTDVLVTYPAGRKKEIVNIKPGTIIGDTAFWDTQWVGKVVIPDDCTVQSTSFFRSGVESLEVSSNNESIIYNNGAILSPDGMELWTYLAGCRNESFTVPDSVETIQQHAFNGNPYLVSLDMPDTVTKIYAYAFYNCTALKNVHISNNVAWHTDGVDLRHYYTSIFDHCSSLETIEIPEGSTILPSFMFSECYMLNSIVLPSSLKEIRGLEIAGDRALCDIYYRGTEDEWKKIDFPGCDEYYVTIHYNFDGTGMIEYADDMSWSLNEEGTLTITGTGAMKPYSGRERTPWHEERHLIKRIVIQPGITGISKDAFGDCPELESVSIPDTVTTIGRDAFQSCVKLSSIQIPDSVKTIAIAAYNDCQSAEEIIIGNGVESISEVSFAGCTSAKRVHLGSCVNFIDTGAFYSCDSISEYSVDVNNASFSAEDGILYNKDQTVLVGYPAGRTDGEYTVAEGVVRIGDYAFSSSKLEQINLPDSLKTIGESAFVYSYNLKSIVIPDQVKFIEKNAFCNLNLKSAIIGDGIRKMGELAFGGCYSLKNVAFTGDAPEIDSRCFEGDTCTIYYRNTAQFWEEASTQNYGGNITWCGVDQIPTEFEHELTWVEEELQDCEIEGHIGYWICSGCGKLFSDYDCQNEITKEDTVLPAIGHDWDEGKITKEATCTEAGVKTFTCQNDPGHTRTEAIPAKGHDLVKTEAKAANCENGGNIEYWTCSTCEKLFKDSEGKTEINKEDTVIPATGHDWDAGKITKEATCTEDGVKTFICLNNSGHTMTKSIPATGHNLTRTEAKAATCESEGNIEFWTCSSCEKLFKDSEGKTTITKEDTVIPATGHKWSEWTVMKPATATETGIESRTCSNCGETETREIPVKPSENPFSDVKDSDYFFDPVLWAVNHDPQITKGTSDTTFSPSDTCTRGQAVTFLWRACGCEKVTDVDNPFTDVKSSDYFYDAVLWAYKNKVTTGTTSTTFGPNDTCNRGQIVTFLWRSQGQPTATASIAFTDVASDAYYYAPVRWAVENEITKGTTDRTFSPNDSCTRGQIVTFLYRAKGVNSSDNGNGDILLPEI